jgi:Serine/Threonine/Tyrosine Kinase found in polyvalent proteins
MLDDASKDQLSDIITGKIFEGSGSTLQAARNHLAGSFKTSKTIERDFDRFSVVKEEQTQALKEFALGYKCLLNHNQLEWTFLSEGGESKVFLTKQGTHVIKMNDAVYYNTWLDFLNSILLHNLFFPETAYELLGFSELEGELYALLKQAYIIAQEITDLDALKNFMHHNGFQNTRGYDYYSANYGICIEDLHDENVLTQAGIFFFIDTVFLIDLRT